MRQLHLCAAISFALLLTACSTGGGDAPDEQRLDRAAYERLLDRAQQSGSEAFAAAADSVGISGEGTITTVGCSGAPLGVVRLQLASDLVFDAARDEDAAEQVARAWEGQGLSGVTVEDSGAVRATTEIDDVAIAFILSDSGPMQDGSGQRLRSLSLTSECFDVGEDLAREIG